MLASHAFSFLSVLLYRIRSSVKRRLSSAQLRQGVKNEFKERNLSHQNTSISSSKGGLIQIDQKNCFAVIGKKNKNQLKHQFLSLIYCIWLKKLVLFYESSNLGFPILVPNTTIKLMIICWFATSSLFHQKLHTFVFLHQLFSVLTSFLKHFKKPIFFSSKFWSVAYEVKTSNTIEISRPTINSIYNMLRI